MVTLQVFQSKAQASFWQSFLPTPLQLRRSRMPGFRPPDSGVGSEVLAPGDDSGPVWSILAGPSSGFAPDMCPPSRSSIHLSHIHSLSRDSHAKHFIRTPNRQICPWPPRLPNRVHSWLFFNRPGSWEAQSLTSIHHVTFANRSPCQVLRFPICPGTFCPKMSSEGLSCFSDCCPQFLGTFPPWLTAVGNLRQLMASL